MVSFRYTEWDGSQEIPALDPDKVLEALTDDLMNFGDLQHALRNMLQRGMRDPMGQRLDGLRDLLQQLRQQRRSTLDQYNLGSAFEDIEKRLQEVLDVERATLDRRLQEAHDLQGDPTDDAPAATDGSEPAASERGEGGEADDPVQGSRPAAGTLCSIDLARLRSGRTGVCRGPSPLAVSAVDWYRASPPMAH